MIDLDELYAFAVQLGKDAGKLLQDAVDRRCEASQENDQLEHVQKDNAVDLVTQTDEGMTCPYVHDAVTSPLLSSALFVPLLNIPP